MRQFHRVISKFEICKVAEPRETRLHRPMYFCAENRCDFCGRDDGLDFTKLLMQFPIGARVAFSHLPEHYEFVEERGLPRS